MHALDHAVARELGNGVWTVLGLFLILALAHTLYDDMRNRDGWYYDRGTALVIGMLVYFVGSIMRSLYIWLYWVHGEGGWWEEAIKDVYWVLFIATMFAVAGGLCILRVCLAGSLGSWAWIAAGVVAVMTPLAVYWWV